MHSVPNIVFAACFISILAVSLPAQGQDTSGHTEAHPLDRFDRPEKSALPVRRQREYYISRRWGHDVRKRKRQHCIGYHAGECLLVPVAILGDAMQDYSGGGSSSPVILEICGGALGLFALGLGIMYLGDRHEAHHPQKFLPTPVACDLHGIKK